MTKELTTETFPLVAPNDNGIRPAGKPDECFYCRSKVGVPHKPDCVSVTKKVWVRYSFQLEIEVPHSWTEDDLEFHHNEGSWCANNSIDELTEAFRGDGQACACASFECEYLETTDATPRSKTREPDRSAN